MKNSRSTVYIYIDIDNFSLSPQVLTNYGYINFIPFYIVEQFISKVFSHDIIWFEKSNEVVHCKLSKAGSRTTLRGQKRSEELSQRISEKPKVHYTTLKKH